MLRLPLLGWTPALWASWKPFGIGEQRPRNFREVFRAIWENRSRLDYAWRILNQGVCDGCSLGTTGLRDWTLEGIHLCNIRLRLLRLNTMEPMDPELLSDVGLLSGRSNAELRSLGRLAYPMLRLRAEPGFRRISWDEAFDRLVRQIQASGPERLAFYLTSRGMSNESYYAAQKAVRALGTNSIDNAARVCHSPSTSALKQALGVAATTCSYRDWIGSDLIVFIGCNVANSQPVAVKYLHYAKKAGTRIAVVNNFAEPGLQRYWVPSIPESALFGTKLADRTFLIHTGGDIPFINGTLKHLLDQDWVDWEFIRQRTANFEDLVRGLGRQSWEELERSAGATREEMLAFARMVSEARTAVFVWSMGVTQHQFGEATVSAIVNLALTRGFVGREKCGLMPIRGHSGVQGGAEMGAYATAFPGGLTVNAQNAGRLSEQYGFAVPSRPGLTAPEMIDAAHEGELDLLFAAGGNFLDVLPEPDFVRQALERVPLRVHLDLVLNRQMLLEPGEAVLLLPAATRYEGPGAVTQTSTERRVILSPEIPGPRVGEARQEWQVFTELARRARPDLAGLLAFKDTAAIRAEIGRVIPDYAGIERLEQQGDQFQYGGPQLCWDWRFPTPDGKAHFTPVEPPKHDWPAGAFMVSTRRGKQFNSMVHESRDLLTGAGRETVLISRADADRLGLQDGDRIRLSNSVGSFSGRAQIAPVQPGNLQLHWPEGNVLIGRHTRSPKSGIPDYNAAAWLEKLEVRDAASPGK